MATLDIRIYPDPVLTEPTQVVEDFGPETQKLIDDMAETMYLGDGIGLAATQVGVSKRIMVMDVPQGEEQTSNLMALVNPRIVERDGEVLSREGCLSFPGLTVQVTRSSKVTVAALDRQGEEVTVTAEGLAAICLQHEIDHLDGNVFIDRLSPLKRRFALAEFRKLQRYAEAAAEQA